MANKLETGGQDALVPAHATVAAKPSGTELHTASLASAEATIDLNGLAAKAMKAKLMGQVAEHKRLGALIEKAKKDGIVVPQAQPQPTKATGSQAEYTVS